MKTFNAGANAERTAIMSKVRRLISASNDSYLLTILLGWLRLRSERCNRKKGGIGK
jgi:hypothetical protein